LIIGFDVTTKVFTTMENENQLAHKNACPRVMDELIGFG
jgi:inosine-uridine nucleoside N-ribohydrolase